ncbi:MAG: lipoyl(octanoyl) transferase LipB [Bacteroidota bacterium]|nr:lipoyl(octanoyl) transferase LipB [Bacteroidota bacterium]MDX5431358.1 lipoyl(octanoyl) transferase LipB [Bacteroidota bacterium]MDX5470088.1 lipoyl(octanoyl) transferase LipB [Bacteroidota bacterium]
MRKVIFEELGTMAYQEAWDYQEKLFGENVAIKLAKRKAEVAGIAYEGPETRDFLLYVEHPHVYTLGKSGHINNLLVDEKELEQINATFVPINRGGDITYHGYGQLVAYPIFDLEYYFTDIHKFLRYLEEAIILTVADYGIPSGRIDGLTGVWIEPDNMDRARKICAMGIRCSRWITMHGLALNVNTDLNYFKHIVPCGIDDKAVTSLEAELGHLVSMDEVKERVKRHLAQLFSIEFDEVNA